MPGGNLITVSHEVIGTGYLGRLIALAEAGFCWSAERWIQVRTQHPFGGSDDFQVAVLEQGKIVKESLLSDYHKAFIAIGLDECANMYKGELADWMKFLRTGKLFAGKRLYNSKGEMCAEYSLWENRYDSTAIWQFVREGTECMLANYDLSRREALEKALNERVESCVKSWGALIREMSPC